MPERLLTGALTKVSLLCAAVTAWAVYHHLRERGGWRVPWVQVLVIFLGMMVVSETLDQSRLLLQQSLGTGFQNPTYNLLQACEEGLELLLPVLLFTAALLFARAGAARQTAGGAEENR